MKKLAIFALMLMMLATLFSGCGSKQAGNMIIAVNVGGEPSTLDPRKMQDTASSHVAIQLFEGLVVFNSKNETVPACAEKWDVSADQTIYTFHLRDGMKWSNGDPLTAKDFETAWKNVLDPQFASEYASILFFIKNGEAFNSGKAKADDVGIKVIDDKTLQVTLEGPCPFFAAVTAHTSFFPVNSKSDFTKAESIICNGPFKITEWTHGSSIEAVKNDQYWDKDKVKADGMKFVLTEELGTALQMFKAGQIQFVDTALPAEIPNLIKDGTLKPFPSLGVYYYDFNTTKKPYNDVRVRKALAYAIDREAIVNKITKAGQKIALAQVPYGAPDAAPGSDFRKVGGDYFKNNDIETAKKLLAEAGYPNGKGFPTITLKYNTSERHKAIAEAVQEMWKDNLGIKTTLHNEEFKTLIADRNEQNYDVARDAWVADYPDAFVFLDMFISNNGQNCSKYNDKKYDALISQSRLASDPAKRMQLMHDAEKQLMEDMPIMPIFFDSITNVVSPKLKGAYTCALSIPYFKEAYIEQ